MGHLWAGFPNFVHGGKTQITVPFCGQIEPPADPHIQYILVNALGNGAGILCWETQGVAKTY